jgi:hypothetical protein
LVRINYGGDLLVPHGFGSLYTRPLTGAVLDLLDSGLLIAVTALFLRRRRSALMLIAGCSMMGGWASDLLDRLVMHYWTAPGSVRGVVDFIPIGRHYYNLADLFIVGGTPLFVLAVCGSVLRRVLVRPPASSAHRSPTTFRPRRLLRAMLAVSAAVVLTSVVAVGAATFGGDTAPTASASISYGIPSRIS